ncbi:MAG: hypothetical protein K9L28_09400 [Synergistales bacterium]|nr:hypothetical protein [Synergistales bacterium]
MDRRILTAVLLLLLALAAGLLYRALRPEPTTTPPEREQPAAPVPATPEPSEERLESYRPPAVTGTPRASQDEESLEARLARIEREINGSPGQGQEGGFTLSDCPGELRYVIEHAGELKEKLDSETLKAVNRALDRLPGEVSAEEATLRPSDGGAKLTIRIPVDN